MNRYVLEPTPHKGGWSIKDLQDTTFLCWCPRRDNALHVLGLLNANAK